MSELTGDIDRVRMWDADFYLDVDEDEQNMDAELFDHLTASGFY